MSRPARDLLVRTVLRACRLLGRCSLPTLHRFGRLMGRWSYWRDRNSRRIVEANLTHTGWDNVDQLTAQCLIEQGKFAFEQTAIWHWPVARLIASIQQIDGIEHFHAARQQGKGLIIAMPHLGGFELMNAFLCQNGGMLAMYRPPNVQALDAPLKRYRQRFGAELVATDARGIRRLLQGLRENKNVCLLPDQTPSAESGVVAPLFGQPALTMTLLPRLISRQPSAVLFAAVIRLPSGRGFHLHFTPAPAELWHPDPSQATCALNQSIEKLIHLAPAQYTWNYKRFKGVNIEIYDRCK